MNETTTAAVAVTDNVSEYHIGHTTYRVTTTFNPAFRQSLELSRNVQSKNPQNLR